MTHSSTAEANAVALDKDLSSFTRSLFVPLMLMLNFSFFQYLVLLFHARWREKRVLLLLLVSSISVGSLVPFATQSDETVANLNDVSESCLALILLVQTALVGTRHAPKGKTAATGKLVLQVSKPLQYFADLLILFDCGVVVLGLVCVFRPAIATEFGGTNRDQQRRGERDAGVHAGRRGVYTKPIASEEIRLGHIVPMIDASATYEDETLSDRADDQFSQDPLPASEVGKNRFVQLAHPSER